jgi:hypothetical protein
VEGLRPADGFDLGSIRLKDVDISFNLCNNGASRCSLHYVPSIRFLDVSGNAFSGAFQQAMTDTGHGLSVFEQETASSRARSPMGFPHS